MSGRNETLEDLTEHSWVIGSSPTNRNSSELFTTETVLSQWRGSICELQDGDGLYLRLRFLGFYHMKLAVI